MSSNQKKYQKLAETKENQWFSLKKAIQKKEELENISKDFEAKMKILEAKNIKNLNLIKNSPLKPE